MSHPWLLDFDEDGSEKRVTRHENGSHRAAAQSGSQRLISGEYASGSSSGNSSVGLSQYEHEKRQKAMMAEAGYTYGSAVDDDDDDEDDGDEDKASYADAKSGDNLRQPSHASSAYFDSKHST